MAAEVPLTEAVIADVWSLGAEPDRIEQAAAAWRRLAGAGYRLTGDAVARGQRLRQTWRSFGADSYTVHLQSLTGPVGLSGVAEQARRITETLGDIAAEVRQAQHRLALGRAELARICRVDEVADGTVRLVFHPDRQAAVQAAIDGATGIRGRLDDALAAYARVLQAARDALAVIADKWRAQAGNTADRPYPVPTPPGGPTQIFDRDAKHWYVYAPGARVDVAGDTVTITRDNLPPQVFQAPEGTSAVTVHSGPGDNRIDVREPTASTVTVVAGDGRDEVSVQAAAGQTVQVLGGAGNDQISTSGGRVMVSGNAGNDVIQMRDYSDALGRGGAGQDRLTGVGSTAGTAYLSGGDGRDLIAVQNPGATVLDGGAGRDALYPLRPSGTALGGSGNDFIAGIGAQYGGSGADIQTATGDGGRLDGGSGPDTLIASGTGRVDGGSGADQVFDHGQAELTGVEQRHQVPETNLVEGYQRRVEVVGDEISQAITKTNLGHLGGVPEGQEALRRVVEAADRHPDVTLTVGEEAGGGEVKRVRAEGTGNLIGLNVTYDAIGTGPIQGTGASDLFHENLHLPGVLDGTTRYSERHVPPEVVRDFAAGVPGAEQRLADAVAGRVTFPDPTDAGEYVEERIVTGLPVAPERHQITDAQQIVDPVNENAYRRQVGMPERPAYNVEVPGTPE
ncbi:hypothetical protein GCM10022225_11340 [Plantactinospora mayteni]|uniref:Calcium-binding protein n=1 Tax=Plantactinospora mayteni TaxID=566021 RepID=A0ABQ4EHI9_9ACTN|nr:calcium-binding protein [Plantactinospora mayteni]GIG94114.1 hypothetical protein Pma05_06870 [Plantactinospora mayteni]